MLLGILNLAKQYKFAMKKHVHQSAARPFALPGRVFITSTGVS